MSKTTLTTKRLSILMIILVLTFNVTSTMKLTKMATFKCEQDGKGGVGCSKENYQVLPNIVASPALINVSKMQSADYESPKSTSSVKVINSPAPSQVQNIIPGKGQPITKNTPSNDVMDDSVVVPGGNYAREEADISQPTNTSTTSSNVVNSSTTNNNGSTTTTATNNNSNTTPTSNSSTTTQPPPTTTTTQPSNTSSSTTNTNTQPSNTSTSNTNTSSSGTTTPQTSTTTPTSSTSTTTPTSTTTTNATTTPNVLIAPGVNTATTGGDYIKLATTLLLAVIVIIL